MNSVLPTLTRTVQAQFKTGDSSKTQKIIQYCFDFLVVCGLPMVVGTVILAYHLTFAVSSPKFLSRLTEGFYGSDVALQILIFALFFSYINTLLGFVLIAFRKQNYLVWVSGAAVLLSLALNIFSIPKYGLRGAGVTSVVAELGMMILLYIITHRFLDYKINFKIGGRALFSALTMGVVLWLTRDVLYRAIGGSSLFLVLPLGVLVYVTTMYLVGGITKEMWQMIKAKKTPADSSL